MHSTDHIEIETIIKNWVIAIQKRDIAGILANHSENIIMYDVPPPFQSVGIEEYKNTWEQSFFNGTESGVYKVLEMTIEAGIDIAYCFGILQCSWNNNGVFEDIKFRLTIGLKKLIGKWIIFHEHHSIPSN